MLLFVFDGLLLLRFAERQLLPLLFQLPPRFTRFEPLRPLSQNVDAASLPRSKRLEASSTAHQLAANHVRRKAIVFACEM